MSQPTKHTPGPWRYDVQNHQIRSGEPTERRFSGELISTVSPLNPEMQANALLISAAPDMLAALKAIAKVNLSKSKSDLEFAGNTLEGMQAIAEAAIAKAEGGAQ